MTPSDQAELEAISAQVKARKAAQQSRQNEALVRYIGD